MFVTTSLYVSYDKILKHQRENILATEVMTKKMHKKCKNV